MSRDRDIAEQFRRMPCQICGSRAGVVGHHLLTVGAHPEYKNVPENIMALCWAHHAEIHNQNGTKGMTLPKFVEKYFLEKEMQDRGFDFCDYSGKWFIPLQ